MRNPAWATSRSARILNTPYVTLNGGEEFAVRSVQAMFKRNRDEAVLAPLAKGQQVSIVCDIRGLILLNVVGDSCALAR